MSANPPQPEPAAPTPLPTLPPEPAPPSSRLTATQLAILLAMIPVIGGIIIAFINIVPPLLQQARDADATHTAEALTRAALAVTPPTFTPAPTLTHTPDFTATPTLTTAPTWTPVPPTNTAVPPTDTAQPPTATAVPPTPTNTTAPTWTPVPPTAMITNTPAVPTADINSTLNAAPILLYYDASGIVVYNNTTSRWIEVTQWVFRSGDQRFNGIQWKTVNDQFDGLLRPGECLQVARYPGLAPALPDVCANGRESLWQAGDGGQFWRDVPASGVTDDIFTISSGSTFARCAVAPADSQNYALVCPVTPP